ncbi:DUF2092 domain-containing protein [Phaeobacter marinintestinus]|uniref:DUF2092 domain-containing protein n=1 Tax=Falsiphaeobacter marinintestinus TaxID=1492905 RepID=UPI0011B4979C|nr:DUF2092 domain-containing protein [Phaeobacter marinintestinus]
MMHDTAFRSTQRQLIRTGLAFTLIGGLVVQASAQTDETEAIDPFAMEIANAAIDYISGQPRLSVDWFVSFDVVVDGREKVTYSRSGSNLLARGEGFYAFSELGEETREYFYDFSRFTVVDVEENAYATTPFRGEFRALTERVADEYDLRLPIWTLMSADPGFELLESVDAAAYLGTTRIAGQQVHHLAMSDYEGDWQFWISTDPEAPELVMLVGTNPYEQGWPQYRAYFSNWDFDPQINEDSFVFTPDETTERMVWPKPDPKYKIGRGEE